MTYLSIGAFHIVLLITILFLYISYYCSTDITKIDYIFLTYDKKFDYSSLFLISPLLLLTAWCWPLIYIILSGFIVHKLLKKHVWPVVFNVIESLDKKD